MTGFAVKLDKWTKTLEFATNYGTIKGSPRVPERTKEAGVPPTPTQMGRGFLQRPRINRLSRQRRPVLTCPMNVDLFADFEQKIELFREKQVVVIQIEAEQGERFDRRATPGHDLSTTM